MALWWWVRFVDFSSLFAFAVMLWWWVHSGCGSPEVGFGLLWVFWGFFFIYLGFVVVLIYGVVVDHRMWVLVCGGFVVGKKHCDPSKSA